MGNHCIGTLKRPDEVSTSGTHSLQALRSLGLAACRAHPAVEADGALRALSGGPPKRSRLPISPIALTVVIYALSEVEAVGYGWPSCDAHAGQRVIDFQALQSI